MIPLPLLKEIMPAADLAPTDRDIARELGSSGECA